MRTVTCAVAILMFVTQLPGQAPRWSATRDLRIGDVDDPEYALTWMQGIALGNDGSFYSLHYPEKLVRMFDAQGRLKAKFGRGGEGPGEFNNPAGIGWRGDSLYVWDSVDQRFNLFLTDGTFRNAVTIRSTNADPAGGRGAWPTALLADGSALGTVNLGDPRPMSAQGMRAAYVRMTRKGDVTDTLAFISSSFLRFSDPNRQPGWSVNTRHPFGSGPLLVIAGDRSSIYVIDRPVAANATAGSFVIHRLSLKGDTVMSRRVPYVPQRVARQLADSLTESYIKMLSTQDGERPPRLSRGEAEKLVKSVFTAPAFHPPVQAVVVGHDGTLWLQREGLGASTVTWLAMDASVNPLGVVDLPRGFQMHNGTRQFVIGVENDELDIPYITRYRIAPASTRR